MDQQIDAFGQQLRNLLDDVPFHHFPERAAAGRAEHEHIDRMRRRDVEDRIGDVIRRRVHESPLHAELGRDLLGLLIELLSFIVGRHVRGPSGTDRDRDVPNKDDPPSNSELRELLLQKIDCLPDLSDLPNGFQSVMREIDRYLAARPQSESAPDALPTKDITEVRSRLKNRSMVLIGGVRRPSHYQSLKDAFGLKELIWIETKEHQSFADFEPSVSHPDVAVVVLAIRWSSHVFGNVNEFCDRYNKPLTRLTTGFNPNQVAAQIMNQCGKRLPVQAPEKEE